ncbi:hypothetical protein OSTOST_06833 [Ostertagia ostertagi]
MEEQLVKKLLSHEVPTGMRQCGQKIFSPIDFPRYWEVGDKALVEMLDYHPREMDAVMNESWDLVIADELFSVASYALAMKGT